VFVYPICLPKFCSLAHIGELEMAKVVKEVQTAHSGAEVQDLGSFVGERNGKRYEALKARIKIPKDGRWLSFAYLAPIDDVYVKIRFTQPEGEDHESVVDGVVASLLSEFRFKNPKAHKHEIAPTLLVHSRETETGKSHVLSALLSYGAFMSIEVEKGRYIDSLDRSLNCWEPTLKILEGITSKQPAGAVDTSFAGMIAARNAGYLREYVWTYFRRPYWTQPGDLKLEEFKVWSSRNLKDHLPADVSRVLVEWK